MTDLSEGLNAAGTCLDVADDPDAFNDLVMERGWGDGLPVVPPTDARVAAMLRWCDRSWDKPVASIAPRYGEATPIRLAANAVMAGCKPEYFPLVMLAIEAICEETFNIYSIQATTHPCAPLLIFNGPVVQELGINAGHNAFGPGARANATIGRAVRLALLNIGGGIPGGADMATLGSPAKYTFCIAENEEASPWEPLHVERGFPADASTVTVVGAEAPHNANDHKSTTAEGVLTSIAGTMATTGSNDVLWASQTPALVLCPEHAAIIGAAKFSKADVKRFLQEHAWLSLGKFSPENVELRFKSPVVFNERYAEAGPDARIYALQRAEDLIVIVAGGSGKHSAYLPTLGGSTHAVTRPLKHSDGSLCRSIEEFRP